MIYRKEVSIFKKDALEDKFSSIEQREGEIELAVGGKVGTDEIISRINLTPEAAKIQASKVEVDGTLIIGKSTAETIAQNEVNKLEIGGRNLLVGTGTSISKATTATTAYVTQSLYYTPNHKMLSELGFSANDEVTLSFDWAITAATTYGNARIEWYGKTSSSEDGYIVALISPFATFSASNTSGHVEKTVKLTSSTINAKRLLLRIDNSKLTLTISNLKLERGTKATDWTPAPEDLPNDLASSTGTTVIDGGHITTGSITVGQVNGLQSTLNNKASTASVNEAAKTATSYLTEIASNGVFVHEASAVDVKPTDTRANGVHISDDVDIIRNGEVAASYGDTTQIGKDGESHIEIDYHSFKQIDMNGDTFVWFSDLRDTANTYEASADFVRESDRQAFSTGSEYRYNPDLLPVDTSTVKLEYGGQIIQRTTPYYTTRNKLGINVGCKGLIRLSTNPSTGDVLKVVYISDGVEKTTEISCNSDQAEYEYCSAQSVHPILKDAYLNGNLLNGWTVAQSLVRIYGSESFIPAGATFYVKYTVPDTVNTKAYTLGTRNESNIVGLNSFCFGENVSATRGRSAAFGLGTVAKKDNSFVVGQYNEPTTDAIFTVGSGTKTKSQNAFEVDYDGEVYIKYSGSSENYQKHDYFTLIKRGDNYMMQLDDAISLCLNYGVLFYTEVDYTFDISKERYTGANLYYKLITTKSDFGLSSNQIVSISLDNDAANSYLIRFVRYSSLQWVALSNAKISSGTRKLRIVYTQGKPFRRDPSEPAL